MPESPGAEKQDKEKEHRDCKKSKGTERAACVSTIRAHFALTCIITCVFLDPAMKSATMESADQKKTRVKLKKFLTRRPTLQAVRDKGYIKGDPQTYTFVGTWFDFEGTDEVREALFCSLLAFSGRCCVCCCVLGLQIRCLGAV